MKKARVMVTAALAALLLSVGTAAAVSADEYTDSSSEIISIESTVITASDGEEQGFVTKDGFTYYYVNGKMKTGWQKIDGYMYYFKKTASSTMPKGAMFTELKTINGYKYYFGDNGIMHTGWQIVDGTTYYFKKSASSTTPKGAALTGLKTINGNKYYFGTNGKMKTGWQKINGKTYYFKKGATESHPMGSMLTGLKTISGHKYYFSSNGVMKTGWQTINGKTYYFKKSASSTTPKGAAFTGLKTIKGNKYYFSSNGVMKTGWQTINGKTYYFKKSASSTTPKGAALTGLKTIKGNKYYFSSKGVMKTGWQKINGKTYYFKKSASSTTPKGAMIKGYITISGKKYYFSSKGVLQKGKIVGTKSKGYYYADEDGICVTSSEIKYAVDFVMSHSDSGDSASERLKSCYDYLYLNYTYTRSYYAPDASNMSDEAVIMFENKSGNCYKYAAAFACIAKVLGYDSQVATGQVSAVNGGTTPHAVTRVKVDGTWYICDSQLQASYHQRAFYMTTESKYPTTYLKLDTFYTLTISEGKVTWK